MSVDTNNGYDTSNEPQFKKRKQFIVPKSTNPIGDEGISECFQKFTTSLYVSLAPCHISNPINGVKSQHLDPLIMSYFPKAKGVCLAYSNIKISDDNVTKDTDDNTITVAKVTDSSPFTFLWVSVDFLIWRPQVGDTLEGYIYMQTASHIGLLVHDTFNASIKKFNIPVDWNFIPSQEDEYSEEVNDSNKFKSFGYWADENNVKIEGKLKFTIKSIHTTGKVVSLDGTLIKPGSERDAQPIFRERRSSSSSITASQPGKHKKFDEEDIPTVTEIPEPKEDDLSTLPGYSKQSDDEEEEDSAVVNNSDSEEDSD